MREKEVNLYEVSWEVCNKVGGIYTVISSKTAYITPRVPNYFLVGPYLPNRPSKEFVEELIPEELREVFSELKNKGIIGHYGKWLIKSEPRVILLDFSNFFNQKNDIKSKLWEKYGIDSLNAGFDFDEPVVFSVAAAEMLNLIEKKTKRKIIAQFHEWMTGAGILWLKNNNSNIGTIFTTHATVLGRAIAAVNSSFYTNLKSIDVDREAREHGVISKHQMEKASAKYTNVFTTVSEITGIEAEYLLSRKPDVILPNGIDMEHFSSFEEISIKHSELKHEVKDFIMSFFFPYYSFDLDNTLIFFIMGRYEFENKGIDILIESLGKLNEQLKKENSNKTVVTFFFIPAATYNISQRVLENKTIFFDIKNTINKEKNSIIDKLVNITASQEKLDKVSILDETLIENLHKKAYRFVKKGNPPYSTHDLSYYDSDPIISGLNNAKLFNHKEDRVKAIFYPAYLSSSDNLLNLDLYDAITSGHLGIFASAYEPWGYTPVESAALGVASITSDLSGFGRYIEKETKEKNPGIFVLKRFGISKKEIVENMYQIFKNYTSLDKEGRIQNKIEARRLAALVDWRKLIDNYFIAYDKAAENGN